jgi:hypothetical protein
MQVLAEVHNVRHHNGQKLKAEVSLIVSEPDEIIRLRLFDAHEKQGLVQQFEKLKGKSIQVPLEIDVYQGKLSYSLSYSGIPKSI